MERRSFNVINERTLGRYLLYNFSTLEPTFLYAIERAKGLGSFPTAFLFYFVVVERTHDFGSLPTVFLF
jgi:hypothetical protein